MCGRFSLTVDLEQIAERFQISNKEEVPFVPRYNIAPTQNVLAVMREGEERIGGLLRWGLVPFWAKDTKMGHKLINARAETLEEKPSFRHLIKRRRCLVIADSFYEWTLNTEGKKQPMRIHLTDERLFAFAGLWDCWEKGEQVVYSCTIITTDPNSLMKQYHHRMPVILPPSEEERWLDPELEDIHELKQILRPYDAQEMRAYPVSTLVNSPANDSPEVLLPL